MVATALINGRIIDGNGGPPVENGALLIVDNLIEAVGTDVDIPPDAQVIDVQGKSLLPGMMDLHVHLRGPYHSLQKLRKSLLAGFTTIAHVAGTMPPASTDCRQAIEDGWFPECARLLVGAVVDCTNGHVRGRIADGPWEVRKAVREMVQAKADFIKTAASGGFWAEDEETWWRDYTQEELDALADEAHSVGRLVVVHCHTQPGLDMAIQAGCDQIHHGALIDEKALKGILEKELFFVPTLRVTSRQNMAIKFGAGRPWETRKMGEAHYVHREGVRLAHKMGVKMGLGTDCPSTPPWDIWDSGFELQEFVGCGLSPLEAIGVATKGSAEAMKIDDKLGTLEKGKIADVVVVDGDPAGDIQAVVNYANIRYVFKEGRLAVSRDPARPATAHLETYPPDFSAIDERFKADPAWEAAAGLA